MMMAVTPGGASSPVWPEEVEGLAGGVPGMPTEASAVQPS